MTAHTFWPETLKLLLLPGLDGTSAFSKAFLSRFPARDNLITLDYPSDSTASYDDLADFVLAHTPKSERFILFAQSFSGPIARRVLDHPRLAGLVLCASFLSSPRPFFLHALSRLPLEALLKLTPPRFLAAHACFGGNYESEQIDLFYQTSLAVPSKTLAHRLRLIASEPDPKETITSKKPVCYLRPLNDRLIPQAAVDRVASLLPDAKIKLISGGHFLLQTSPDAVVEEVCRFANFVQEEG